MRSSTRVLGKFQADDHEEIRPFLSLKKEVAEVLLEPFVGIQKVLVGKSTGNYVLDGLGRISNVASAVFDRAVGSEKIRNCLGGGGKKSQQLTSRTPKKSTKRVRFSTKDNLVWNCQSPLPPLSLRVPPSATPRGSALKKGVRPGPIRRTPKKVIKPKSVNNQARKVRKSVSVSPPVKRTNNLKLKSQLQSPLSSLLSGCGCG